MLSIWSCILLLLANQACANTTYKYGSFDYSEYDRPGPIDNDVKGMVKQMTLQEKIGQMTQLNEDLILNKDGTLNKTAVEHYASNYYIGSYLNQLASNGINYDAIDYAKIIGEIQEITLSVNSTFKVPIIYGLDNIHGAQYIANTTIFPQGINIAATFDPKFAYNSASITARDTRAAGVQWVFAPVLDIPVSKQWPRVYENFGEDPHLSSVMGAAAIRGYQGKYKSDRNKVAACMKHFIAYGAPWSGEDRDSSVVSDRMLYDFFVPGFQAAIDAGVATAMESYIDINGEPVVASKKYLQQLLREQMGFQGMLATDWQEIENLYSTHRVAATQEDAVRLTIGSTSVDMSMVPQDVIFFDALVDLVNKGIIPESRIDESAERLLQLKKDLGLLEKDGWRVDPAIQALVASQDDINVSIDTATESLTLLKNENNTLPFTKNIQKILVVGPTGNSLAEMSGGWTIQWQGSTDDFWHGPADDEQFYERGRTIYQGIQSVSPEGATVDYMRGFYINGTDINMDDVLNVAPEYDAIVACIGEHMYAELPGNIHDMRLPAGQIEKMNKLSSLGKPIVTILVEGRPRVLGNIPECSNALIQSYLPGPWGGIAIGNVLFGNSNPSGRLPYTYPKNAGDLNLNYWRPISDVWDPLYEFGHGLSYSHFTYGNITLNGKNNDELDSNDKARKLYANERETEIEVAITNDSPIDGKETVLMYVEQPVRRVTPFAKLLKDFSKVFIPAGQTVKVKFGVKADMFKYTGIDDVPGNSLDDGPIRILIGDQIFHLNISST